MCCEKVFCECYLVEGGVGRVGGSGWVCVCVVCVCVVCVSERGGEGACVNGVWCVRVELGVCVREWRVSCGLSGCSVCLC